MTCSADVSMYVLDRLYFIAKELPLNEFRQRAEELLMIAEYFRPKKARGGE